MAVPVMATCWSKETAVRVDMGEYVPGGTEMRRKMPLPRYLRLSGSIGEPRAFYGAIRRKNGSANFSIEK